ncbi:MAG: diguanylate cyclase [Chloroflexales bacterium]|nr:diguanylate cyclase [Chloroflexales bacterium]
MLPTPATSTSTYSTLLMIAGLACLFVASIVWRRRSSAMGADALIVYMLALSWWDLTYAVFWAGAPGPGPAFWLNLTYLGVLIAPAALLVFALQLSMREQWQRSFPIAVLAIEPLLVLILLWTDPWHGLFFAGKRTLDMAVILDGGPVFWANLVYSYTLVLLAIGLLLWLFLRSSGLYRRQAAVVLGAIVFSWLNSVIFIARLSPLPDADNTPFVFSVAALGFAFALLRYRLLDVVPIARDVLIERMGDGIVVLDTQGRIVDLNPAARRLLKTPANLAPGAPGERLGKVWGVIRDASDTSLAAGIEARIGEPPQCYLDVRIVPLHDSHQHVVGRLIVCRDITELKRAQAELQHFATTDGLTQIYNRRYFFALARTAVRSAQRLGHPLAMIIMDLDHFKQVNDTYGHAAGDQVLVAFAELCRSQVRAEDLIARFGGEEFIVLLEQTSLATAAQVAERLRLAALQAKLVIDGQPVAITVSLGVAAIAGDRDSLELLVQRADQALYAAKHSGRNQVCVWETGTGMGLARVLRLADLHGGSVALESSPGARSRFSVTLPLTPNDGKGPYRSWPRGSSVGTPGDARWSGHADAAPDHGTLPPGHSNERTIA